MFCTFNYTQAASLRKQLGPKNSKSNESMQTGEELREGTGVQWTRRKDGR